jgi:hypothetical protein
MAKSLELFDNSDYVGGGSGGTLFVDDYTPTTVKSTRGELWMSFINQPSKAPFKIGDVVAGQVVQIPLVADEPVRLYLISHDASGRRTTLGFSNAVTFDFQPNKELKIPVITQDGGAANAQINFIASNYTEKTKFRKIRYADDEDFTTNVVYSLQSSENAQGIMSANFSILRTGDLTATKDVFVQIAHSSNNIVFDRWSLAVPARFAASGGSGGSGGGTPPVSEAPPSGLGLTQASGVVTLNWLNNGGTGNNVIERKINGGSWAELPDEVAYNVATTTDTPTTPGTNIFTYRVKNRNVAGYTLEESITVTVASSSGAAPTGFGYSLTEIDEIELLIDLAWTSNSSSGNIIVERRISLDASWVVIETLAATDESLPQTVFRQTVNLTYYYRISNSLISEYRELSVFILRYRPPRFEE